MNTQHPYAVVKVAEGGKSDEFIRKFEEEAVEGLFRWDKGEKDSYAFTVWLENEMAVSQFDADVESFVAYVRNRYIDGLNIDGTDRVRTSHMYTADGFEIVVDLVDWTDDGVEIGVELLAPVACKMKPGDEFAFYDRQGQIHFGTVVRADGSGDDMYITMVGGYYAKTKYDGLQITRINGRPIFVDPALQP